MIWPATWLGAAAGFAFASIPGALLGGLLGQLLDRQLRLPSWSALLGLLDRSSRLGGDELRFLLLGRLAKLNGRVLPAHIEQARDEMRRLKLDVQSEQLAINAFNRGKNAGADLRRPLRRLRSQRGEAQSLLLSCWRMVGAGGGATAQQRELIMLWGRWRGWSVGDKDSAYEFTGYPRNDGTRFGIEVKIKSDALKRITDAEFNRARDAAAMGYTALPIWHVVNLAARRAWQQFFTEMQTKGVDTIMPSVEIGEVFQHFEFRHFVLHKKGRCYAASSLHILKPTSRNLSIFAAPIQRGR